MTQIKLAKHKGYCFGVKRAIEMVEKVLQDGPFPIWTLGPIIHNPVVIDELCRRGVRVAEDISQVSSGTLVLRTHGTTLAERRRFSPGIERTIDATCPFVARAQNKAEEFASAGKKVLIIGDRNHPEVKAILSYAGPGALCIGKPSDVESMHPEEPKGRIEVIAQTTSRKEDVEKILITLKKKGISVGLSNTICTATEERQEATRELAGQCDLVLVVGGRTSANTGQLLRIARECGPEAYLVESAEDVLPHWFEGKHIVGVAAGASTPDRVIKEVVGKVEELEKTSLEAKPEELQEEHGQDQGSALAPETPEALQEGAAQPEEKTAEELYDESFKTLREGDIVKGKVMSVDENGALVDVGYKSEGVISAQELERRGVIGSFELSPGDEIMVYVLSVESGEGSLRLSKRKADEEAAWKNLEQAYSEQSIVEAPVAQEVKGGLVVDVGVRAFVPASQVERGYVNDLSKYVGQALRMRVLELDRSKNRVILSQRVVLEEEHERLCKETWDTIAEGQIRTGTVKGITDFGVFVDLGGVDGLLHISELSWGRVNHPSEVVHEGQELEVKVLKVDKEKGRISLGRKQVLPDPWDDVETKYPVGAVIKGEVTRTAPFGAFVQIEPGVEGLVHISEISQQHIAKPEEVVNSGDEVMVKVLRTRPDERKISLSIKQADQTLLESAVLQDSVPDSEPEAPESDLPECPGDEEAPVEVPVEAPAEAHDETSEQVVPEESHEVSAKDDAHSNAVPEDSEKEPVAEETGKSGEPEECVVQGEEVLEEATDEKSEDEEPGGF
jgi:small subunit ribosomal protein S1